MDNIRFRAIKSVFKKEIIDILRDKRTLAIMILLPLILYPVLMMVSSQISMNVMTAQDTKQFDVAFDFPMDDRLISLIKDNSCDYNLNVVYPDNAKKALDEHKIMSFATMEIKNGMEVYTIHYKSSDSDSDAASSRMYNVLTDYKELLSIEYINNAGLDPTFVMEPISLQYLDTSEDNEKTGMFLGMILPMIMIIGLVTGAMYPAIDVTSGEKERGTLETLLTLPLSNIELMGGKFLAVSLVAIVSAILNFISLTLVAIFMLTSLTSQSSNGEFSMSIDLGSMLPAFLITLVCIIIFALFVSSVILCITSFAKSFKEANNYLTPVLLIFMLPTFITMIPGITLTPMTSAIPIVNVALLIKDVLTFNYNTSLMATVLVSNVGYTLLGIIILSKLYNSENILFGTNGETNLFERRSNIVKNSGISVTDSIIIYILGALLLFYAGSMLQLRFGFYGIAATQIIILALPVIASLYLKADFVKTFYIKKPLIKDVLSSILIWLGAFIIANILTDILLHFFPQNMEVIHLLEDILTGKNIWITLLVIAVLPAICEEFFFRGFLFSAFDSSKSIKSRSAIIAIAFMFALYHLNFIRLAPTFILGIAFTFMLYKTGSIFIPIIMHFLNNAIAVIITHDTKSAETINSIIKFTDNNTVLTTTYLIIAIILIGIGYKILNISKKEQTLPIAKDNTDHKQ